MALEPLCLVLGGSGGLLPSEDTLPAPPQASGAAFTEVALRDTPHYLHPHTRAASREWTQPWAEWLGPWSPLSRSGLHANGISSDISGMWGSSPRSILAWNGIDASVSLPPPQGAGGQALGGGGWATQTQAATSV